MMTPQDLSLPSSFKPSLSSLHIPLQNSESKPKSLLTPYEALHGTVQYCSSPIVTKELRETKVC